MGLPIRNDTLESSMKRTLTIQNVFAVLLLFLTVHLLGSGLNAVNIGDYARILSPFIDFGPGVFQTFTPIDVREVPFKDSFRALGTVGYPSSYTYLLYGLASLLSLFADSLVIDVVFTVQEFLLALTLFVFLRAFVSKFLGKTMPSPAGVGVALLASVTLLASSGLGFLHSFYQELALLICLPLVLLFFVSAENKKHTVLSLAGLLVVATSKSQFFYLPGLMALFVWPVKKAPRKSIFIALALIQIAALWATASRSGATAFNRYHSSYYGVYQLQRDRGEPLASDVLVACVGIDAWGNEHNLEAGALRKEENVQRRCYQNAGTTGSFERTLKTYLENPHLLWATFFNPALHAQFTRDYFHVYRKHQLFYGASFPIAGWVDGFKESVAHNAFKIVFPLLLAALSVWLLGRPAMPLALFLCSLFYSQIGVSFLGEGYRDLSKHLFPANLAEDWLWFLVGAAVLARWLKRDWPGSVVPKG